MSNSSSFKTAGRPNYSARKALPPNDIAAGSAMPPGALPFNAVVQLTLNSEARAKAHEEAMKRDEARTRAEFSGIYVPQFRPSTRARKVDYEEDPPSQEMVFRGPDSDGFTEVKKKSRKPKRELTTAELNRKMMDPPSDDEDGEYNADLYDNGRRDDLY